jgi:hypothetical protein
MAKGVVVHTPLSHLAHLGRDGGGHRAHRAEERIEGERHARRVAGDHHHGHRLADGAAHAQHHRRDDARAGRRHHHAPDGLPLRGAHGQAGIAVALGHGVQRILGHADDGGQRHVGQDERAREGGQAGRRAKTSRTRGDKGHAEEAQHHRRDAGQHLDQWLQDLACPVWGYLAHKHRCGYAQWQAMAMAVNVTRREPSINGSVPNRPKVGYQRVPNRLPRRRLATPLAAERGR